MWILHLVLFSLAVRFSFSISHAPINLSTYELHSRARIDAAPHIVTCSRNERRVIVSTLREASTWARLAIDTTEDRQTERPDNEQYQAWRWARQAVFLRFFRSFRARTRGEIGMIFESLKWELDRSPGGSRQNDDNGGHVQIFCDKVAVLCRFDDWLTATKSDLNQLFICPRFFRAVDIDRGSGRTERIPGLPREPTRLTADGPRDLPDDSQIGQLISSMLELKAVGRGRLTGGAFPNGIPNALAIQDCMKCKGFVTDLWLESRNFLPAAGVGD